MLMLEQGIAQKDWLICAGVCASTETSGDTVHAKTSVDFVDDYFATLRHFVLHRRGNVNGNGGTVPCGGGHCGNGETVPIDNDGLAVSCKI